MSTWTPGPAWLFCPADRPDRYGKALAAADVVIVDLEDAVALAAKAEAREALRGLVADGTLDPERTVVRVNSVQVDGADSPEHALDVALVAELGLPRVMLAKTETAADVGTVAATTGAEVVALIETPRGVRDVDAIAEAPNLVGLMWGAEDLAAGLGGTSSRGADGSYREVARYARSRSLVAAKASGRLALDSVYLDIPDTDGLAAESADAAASGFDAKVAIHPAQVAPIRSAFLPDAEQVAWAEALLAHVGDDRSVTTFHGRMVDGPVYLQAERVLRLAGASPTAPGEDPS
jgi:citrate lyase subunit beta/citryl-CoA lyase